MQFDPQHSLQLAFRHLDSFSIEGLGTFLRKRVAAQIDHQTKRILPPQERFVLEDGLQSQAPWIDFLARTYHCTAEEAQGFAQRVAEWVDRTLAETGTVQIEGFGKLRREEGTLAEFITEDSIFGQNNDFFGLQPVDYTVGESAKPSLEKKRAAAQTSTLANTTVVEPVRPRRRFPVVGLLLLLILGGLAFAGWHWQADLKQQLESMGWIQPASSDTAKPVLKPAIVLSDSLEQIRKAVMEDSLAQIQASYADSLRKADSVRIAMESKAAKPVVTPTPKPVVTPTPKPVVTPTPKPVVTPTPKPIVTPPAKPVTNPAANVGASIGVAAQRGVYYLIVASATDPNEAKEIAARTAGSKILAPNTSGMHKISIFESAKKSDVIAKMVELKNRYTKSWIFWIGM